MTWLEKSVQERDEIMRQYISEGEQAYMDKGQLSHCPYGLHSQQAIWWKRGFMNAQLGAKIGQT